MTDSSRGSQARILYDLPWNLRTDPDEGEITVPEILANFDVHKQRFSLIDELAYGYVCYYQAANFEFGILPLSLIRFFSWAMWNHREFASEQSILLRLREADMICNCAADTITFVVGHARPGPDEWTPYLDRPLLKESSSFILREPDAAMRHARFETRGEIVMALKDWMASLVTMGREFRALLHAVQVGVYQNPANYTADDAKRVVAAYEFYQESPALEHEIIREHGLAAELGTS